MTLASAACETMSPPAPLALAQRNSEARGGATAIERVRGVDIWIDLRTGPTRLRGRLLANREGCVHVDIYDGDLRIVTGALGADGAWSATAMEGSANVAAGERAAAALRHAAAHPFRLYGLHEFARRGHRVESGEPTTIDGRNYFTLDVTYADGYRATLYLLRNDAVIERMRERGPQANGGARRVETQVSDYREVSGVRFPFLTQEIDIDTLETLSSARVERLQVNTPEALSVCETEPPGA